MLEERRETGRAFEEGRELLNFLAVLFAPAILVTVCADASRISGSSMRRRIPPSQIAIT